MSSKSIAKEAQDIELASRMIRLGARIQVLQEETKLSYDRLTKLYREIHKRSPPKGMLPFSIDWFMSWQPNIHATLFFNTYEFLRTHTPTKGIYAIVDAYKLYQEQSSAGTPEGAPEPKEPPLSFTRAWMLVRFVNSGMIDQACCTQCKGLFVAHAQDLKQNYVCAICKPPPRAGKRNTKSSIASKLTNTPALSLA